jgi:hypothetical protein
VALVEVEVVDWDPSDFLVVGAGPAFSEDHAEGLVSASVDEVAAADFFVFSGIAVVVFI